MTIIAVIAYLLIGIAAGFTGGLLGIGGGLVAVPCLVLIFNLQGFPSTHLMHMAVGTSLGAMVFTSASSAWAHCRQKGVRWDLFISLAPGIICGAIVGAVIADYLPSRQLQFIFGVFVFFIGLYFLLPFKIDAVEKGAVRPHYAAISAWGIIIGAISSIMGIGGGIITVPILTLYKTPLKNAISTSAVTGFLIAFFGALSFVFLGLKLKTTEGSLGYLYMPAFIFIGLASSLGAPFGAKVAYKLPTNTLKKIFGIFLILVGIAMLYR